MKTKLEMAHEWAMKHGDAETVGSRQNMVKYAWDYADAMQAEADKRKKEGVEEESKKSKEVRQKLINTFEKHKLHCSEEWQPDWSQAPAWANWWAMDGFSKKANWYIDKPYLDDDSEVESEWNIALKTNTETYMHAPSFGYTGDWRNSLRKRPQ